ncbi:MAG: class II aldolase/adducin family protein [Mangrovicoccus sp.]|nr:class II aldolase/adducin family protein [Mangrovicoccus sp.]
MSLALAAPDDLLLRQAVIETCLKMNALGINQGSSGNVSARCDGGFLITPSGLAYEAMRPDQIVFMDLEGGYRGDFLPSSEWRMHHDLYRARPEAGAVIHTHSTHATALSCLRQDIPPFHYMIAVAGGSTLRCADYALFGTQELSQAMMAALEDRQACLLGNHGMICCAPGLDKALWLAGEIEALCHQYVIARQMEDPVILTEAQMDAVLARFQTYGKQADELSLEALAKLGMPIAR